MNSRLMGVETEYALTALKAPGQCHDRQGSVGTLISLAARRLPHIADFGSGMFLSNGSRLYVDTGLHPELSTPECSDPAEVVTYILAGERILSDLAVCVKEALGLHDVQVFKVNVDYSGTQTTWGCHESYLHRTSPQVVCNQILPHLVSRVIYTGAGGFNPDTGDLAFTLSPRVAYLQHPVSPESTHSRGIFHTKNETLSSPGNNRLHVICGESLCSETAIWLKLGVTAIVVAMIEAGVCRSEAVQLANPVEAMRSFANDPHCRVTARIAGGGKQRSAIEIQRHYLEQAEEHLHRDFMPDWAGKVCEQWRSMLDRLSKAPDSAMTTLDWAIKLFLYKDHARRQGFEWESLTAWNYIVHTLKSALARTEHGNKPATVEFILGKKSPVSGEVEKLTPYLDKNGLKWEDLSRFTALKREFFEIDTRFGQLGEKGIFGHLNRSGTITHGIERGDIEKAVSSPPEVGRARLRGEFVSRIDLERGRYRCDWRGIWDYKEGRFLDLSDPFESEERWQEFTTSQEAGTPNFLSDRFAEFYRSMRTGRT